jgi:hypothetical protein
MIPDVNAALSKWKSMNSITSSSDKYESKIWAFVNTYYEGRWASQREFASFQAVFNILQKSNLLQEFVGYCNAHHVRVFSVVCDVILGEHSQYGRYL